MSDVASAERALASLSLSKHGFHRPHELEGPLAELLGLPVVTCAAREGASGVERVLAFKDVLRVAVTHIEAEHMRLACGILFFLLSEEELVESGLDGALTESPIGDRRSAITLKLKLRTRFRDRLEPQLRMQLAGELLRYDAAVTASSPANALAFTPAANLAVGDPHREVRASLRRRYGATADVAGLASVVVPDREPYFDAALELRLLDDPEDASRYRYIIELSVTAHLTEYVVALVSRPHMVDYILATCPRITDAYVCLGDGEVLRRATDLCAARDVVRVSQANPTSRAGRRSVARTLKLVPQREYNSYLETQADPTTLGEIQLLRTDLPGAHSKFTTSFSFRSEKSDGLCFWASDRPIFLQSLYVNVRRFSPPESGHGVVRLLPFLMAYDQEVSLREERERNFRIGSWLVQGQGFVLSW